MSYITVVKSSTNAFQALPNTDLLLQSAELAEVVATFGNSAVKIAIREELESFRSEIADNNRLVIDQVLKEDFFGVICERS